MGTRRITLRQCQQGLQAAFSITMHQQPRAKVRKNLICASHQGESPCGAGFPACNLGGPAASRDFCHGLIGQSPEKSSPRFVLRCSPCGAGFPACIFSGPAASRDFCHGPIGQSLEKSSPRFVLRCSPCGAGFPACNLSGPAASRNFCHGLIGQSPEKSSPRFVLRFSPCGAGFPVCIFSGPITSQHFCHRLPRPCHAPQSPLALPVQQTAPYYRGHSQNGKMAKAPSNKALHAELKKKAAPRKTTGATPDTARDPPSLRLP